jgi:hypothetical protein
LRELSEDSREVVGCEDEDMVFFGVAVDEEKDS